MCMAKGVYEGYAHASEWHLVCFLQEPGEVFNTSLHSVRNNNSFDTLHILYASKSQTELVPLLSIEAI